MSVHLIATTAILLLFLIAAGVSAQERRTPLDDYIDNAETIVVAKPTRVGPVNILLRAEVELDVLLVVKGKLGLKTLTVDSQYGMKVGDRYLVRIPKMTGDSQGGRVNEREDVVPLSHGESLDELKQLPPRIVVLRTMNLRAYQLESDIRVKTFELEALNAARKGN